jgi:hypothetical protein
MEGKRVELLVRSEKKGPLGLLTGTFVTERASLHHRGETEHGVFVQLDRGGWLELSPTERTEQPAVWAETLTEGLEPVERFTAA